jgi:Leucine-rich repeat (LRR) protein
MIGEIKSLETLELSKCGLEDIAFLKPLQKLNTLLLADNKIASLAPLAEMAKADTERRFSMFWKIYLKGNPVDPKSEPAELLRSLGGRLHFE